MSPSPMYQRDGLDTQRSFLIGEHAVAMLSGCQRGSLDALTEELEILVVLLCTSFFCVCLLCLVLYRWRELVYRVVCQYFQWWEIICNYRTKRKSDLFKMNGRNEEHLNALLSVSSETGLPHHGVHHLAVIMDGNRRYGKRFAQEAITPSSSKTLLSTCESIINGSALCSAEGDNFSTLLSLIHRTAFDGHRLGGEKLLEFMEHCLEFHVQILTVYAFSQENWSRPLLEVNVLMALFTFYFNRIRQIAKTKGIFVRFISPSFEKIPSYIRELMISVETESRQHSPRRIIVNVCVSYSGQEEIIQACNRLVEQGNKIRSFSSQYLMDQMLRSITQDCHEDEDKSIFATRGGREPQLLLRTSGEQRLSNFLLFECAYTEFFFLNKTWPEITRDDLVSLLWEYSSRNKRLGK